MDDSTGIRREAGPHQVKHRFWDLALCLKKQLQFLGIEVFRELTQV